MKKLLLIFGLTTTLLHSQQEWFKKLESLPFMMNTFSDYQHGTLRTAALKGILIQLEDDWRLLFDTETLRLTSAYQGQIEWAGTPWTGTHGKQITLLNQQALFTTNTGSGWKNETGSFEDNRPIKAYGNLPHTHFLGHYRHGNSVTLHYSVHGTEIWETFLVREKSLTRVLRFGPRKRDLEFLLADESSRFSLNSDKNEAKSESGLQVLTEKNATLRSDDKRLTAHIPQGDEELIVRFSFARNQPPILADLPDMHSLTSGGKGISPDRISTTGTISSKTNQSYLTDLIPFPTDNPWFSNMRFGGFDFLDEDSAALCSWNGEVWVVKGLKSNWNHLVWKRIATGLYETLGLKVVNGEIYVNGRDQITKLIDLNADEEIDYYQVFNRDILITTNFHEFAFDLTTDAEGNFYFSKGGPVLQGGRGFDKILPHHGIVAKISPDGKKFEVIATGLRAPGGVGVGPNGEVTTGENEGTWQPCCKINFVKKEQLPVFFGTEPLRHSVEKPYQEPLMYLPMTLDNSGASQVWVPEKSNFGLKPGELLHLSYGKSTIYRVLPLGGEEKPQAAVVPMPIDLLSSAMRARFHPDGSLYVLGFRGWQTNASTETGFQRIRYNENFGHSLPEKMSLTKTGVIIHFPVSLDSKLVEDLSSWTIQRWKYIRGPQYGSGEFSVDHPDLAAEQRAIEAETRPYSKRDTVKVKSANLLEDGKTVELILEEMKPSMAFHINYDLENKKGDVLIGEIHATIHSN